MFDVSVVVAAAVLGYLNLANNNDSSLAEKGKGKGKSRRK